MLGTGHAITDINHGALPMILTFLQPVLILSQLQVGIVMMAFTLSSSIVQPIFGVLSDRFRAVWLIPLGCLLAGLGIAFSGLSPNYHLLLLAVLFSGLGAAAYHPEGSKFARFASGRRKASGMSLFSVGGNLGFAAGPILALFFYGLAGLNGTLGFLVLNGVMAVFLWANLPVIAGNPEAKGKPVLITERERPVEDTAGANLKKMSIPILLLVLFVMIRSWIHLGLVTFLPQYYVHYLHQSEAYAAILSTVFLFAGVFGTLAGGPAADRWGLKNVIVGSMALLIPLLYLFIHLEGIWVTVVVALAGFAIISTFAVTVVLAQEMMPGNVGLASGLTLGFAIGMGGVGTTFLGWLADQWGLPAVFELMVLFPVIGLVIAFFLPGSQELSRMQGATD